MGMKLARRGSLCVDVEGDDDFVVREEEEEEGKMDWQVRVMATPERRPIETAVMVGRWRYVLELEVMMVRFGSCCLMCGNWKLSHQTKLLWIQVLSAGVYVIAQIDSMQSL